ncbi:tryptophan-rich sensory protein [Candidatus Uhrbacteria bacterium]|nr:tryptophan-rich sensory protein [Candidatus Uhrbacteria bacterium]
MSTQDFYAQLIKPSWAPPGWIFGPVWTVLYTIIAVSFGTIFYKTVTNEIPWTVALPFALNLVFNFAFPLIQFRLVNNLFASVDILLVVGTLIWALYAVWHGAPELRWVVYLNIPYLLWGIFATSVQLSITYLNR